MRAAHSDEDVSQTLFGEVHWDRDVYIGNVVDGIGPFDTLRNVVMKLGQFYARSIGFEYVHARTNAQMRWIQERVERVDFHRLRTTGERVLALEHLIAADGLEKFLADTYSSQKRFGINGAEALVPGLHALCRRASQHGIESIVMGMAHRGRLNVLTNLLQKPAQEIFHALGHRRAFQGDVMYHQGYESELDLDDAFGQTQSQRLSLCANPSHLEAVAPVVEGRVRARHEARANTLRNSHPWLLCFTPQDVAYYRNLLSNELAFERPGSFLSPEERSAYIASSSMGVHVHGDASFAAQGVLSELFAMSDMTHYRTRGAVHIILNNRIGYTTDARVIRSSLHPTDIAKMLAAPIVHVNADDVEAVVRCFELAADFRHEFQADFVIDLVCYRRFGHNELDEPSITQPLVYDKIAHHPPVLELYAKDLVQRGVISYNEVERLRSRHRERLQHEFKAATTLKMGGDHGAILHNWLGTALSVPVDDDEVRSPLDTGVQASKLAEVARTLFDVQYFPIVVHASVEDELAQRLDSVLGDELFDSDERCETYRQRRRGAPGVSWATAEALAFGTLLQEDVHVRISGQDVERGTFNQRHATLVCQEFETKHTPLKDIYARNACFHACNSHLSEAGVLAFEYGYSTEVTRNALVLWEAQFGDFANVAQHIIDNILISGEQKWQVQSGLVLLLPHGFDGAGPEHSSARLERFLQAVSDDPDTMPGESPFELMQINSAFEAADEEMSGRITRDDVRLLLGALLPSAPSEAQISDLLNLMDSNGDGYISKEEWTGFMRKWLQSHPVAMHNLVVANATTPAQFFHLLRRQARQQRTFAKPLVVMTPKWLLHHAHCRSPLRHFMPGTQFQELLVDGPVNDTEPVKRVILCSGQIFYRLLPMLPRNRNTMIVRLEQLAPFPYTSLRAILSHHADAELVWCQEEPKNGGAWSFVEPRIRTCTGRPPKYVGRAPNVTATASLGVHLAELAQILRSAFNDD